MRAKGWPRLRLPSSAWSNSCNPAAPRNPPPPSDLRAARDQLRALRERLGTLHAESSALHTRAEAVQRELAVGNERQAALTRRGEEFERGLQEFDLRREELERERATIAERLADAEARLAEQRASASALEGELAARETERRAAQRALDAAQRAEVEAGAALAERRRRSEQLAAQRERMAREQAEYAESLQAAELALAARRNELSSRHRNGLRPASRRVPPPPPRASRPAASLMPCAASAPALKRIRPRLAAPWPMPRRGSSHSRASSAAMPAPLPVSRPRCSGPKRRAAPDSCWSASILRTPAQLETAIEVALGSRLQNIVVERWADAEDTIAALKRGGQGRATFLPLDTLRRPTTDDRRPTRCRACLV